MVSTTELVEKVYAFCEAVSGKKLFPYQSQPAKRLIRSLLEGDGEVLTTLWSRQCIPADQYVYLSNGTHKQIKDVKIGDKIISINENNEKEEDTVMDRWSTGERPRLLIKTRRGYAIECSPKHLFYTPQGWREAGKLETYSEKIQPHGPKTMLAGEPAGWRHRSTCASIDYGVFGNNKCGKDMAKFLGYMLSDGQYSKSTVKFTNINTMYLKEVEDSVIKLFPDAIVDKEQKGNGFDYYFRTENYGNNSVIDFFKNIGIYGQIKEQRRIPEYVQSLCKEDLKEFINRLWSGDGYITGGEDNNNVEIGIGIPSYHYSMDVLLLLNKFGIAGRLEEQKNGKKQKSRFWKIRISRKADVLRFLNEIGDIYGKEEQCQRVRKFSESREHRTLNYVTSNDISWDTITSIEELPPIEMYDLRTLKNHNFVCNGYVVHNSGKSFTTSVVATGISIILPILANMPMFANDKRLSKFKNGFLMGIFAPALHQAQIIFSNIKKHLMSESAAYILSDPEISVGFDTFNGQNITLKFNNLAIASSITCMSASENSNIVGQSYMLIICDESQDIGNSKYKADISPMGAFYNATHLLIGTPGTTKGFFHDLIEKNKQDYKNGARYKSHYEYDCDVVMRYNDDYAKYIAKEKKTLGETSDEFLMSYKLRWLFERGMFIDEDRLIRLGDESRGRSFADHYNLHVVGIDLGKSQDSTVVSVGELDLENPIIVEENKEKNIPGYTTYEVKLKDWMEIIGDNWDEQYYLIKDYLINFRIHRVVMDATGVGSAIYDRLNNALSCEVVPYVFGLQSKSDLYKHFDNSIKAGHFSYPADMNTQETPEFEHFMRQMRDAEKSYNGQHMLVKAPAGKGNHDDYPDSSALMVWAAKGELVTPETEKNNPFLETKSQQYYSIRNRITARRR